MWRNLCAEIPAPADPSARSFPGNNPSSPGVYITVFEQSLLIENATNKSWSFLASVSVELAAVSLMIITPLIYSDRLPEFHWKSVTVGPPVRPLQTPAANAHRASGPTLPVFSNQPRIFNPTPVTRATPPSQQGATTMDLPPGIPLGDAIGSLNPIGEIVGRPVVTKGPAPVPAVIATPREPMRVSGGVQMAKLVKQVIPIYPPMAKTARISGIVHLIGIIAKDGTIRNLQLISGHPMLTRAAMDAVAQWVYRPTLLSGEPVEVICPIDVNFTLNQ
jgi:protein TonB